MEIILNLAIFLLLFWLCKEDIKTRTVSNIGNLLFLVLAFISARQQGVQFGEIFIFMALYPFPLLFLYGYLSDFLGKDILGFGDIKFLMGVGALLSTNFLWISLYYFYLLSFLIASIMGGIYFWMTKEKEIPMLPAFCLGLMLEKILL